EIVINPGAAFPDCPNHRKLTTIWKLVTKEKTINGASAEAESKPLPDSHVENRRLFKVAAGTLKLEAREQDHLHGCKLCQGILQVFVRQHPSSPVTENPPKSSDAA